MQRPGDFTSSVNKLVDDVKSGNFGNAKDQFSNVESSFQALEKSVKNLSSTKKSSVQSELDSVKGTLDDLGSAGSIDRGRDPRSRRPSHN